MVTAQSTKAAIRGETIDLAGVQGNILRGYRKVMVRHLVVQVADAGKARAWLNATLGPDRSVAPAITVAAHWGDRPPDVCFNLGIAFAGLKALGVPDAAANSFPQAFREGMAARASTIGDFDDSAPAQWQPWFRGADAVHLVLTMHADTSELLDNQEKLIASGLGAQAFRISGRNEGDRFHGDFVHFGYRDSISQPRFFNTDAKDDQPLAPLGTVLLGYSTALEELRWSLPDPPVLGFNGAFNAYRVLEQDVEGFEAFLDRAAAQLLKSDAADELLSPGPEKAFPPGTTPLQAMREVVAAKLCGRWRDGTPLPLSPHNPNPDPPVPDNDFDFSNDVQGLRCPFGAHIRRVNPRSAQIVQRIANHTRRLVRRSFPYGPVFDRTKPDRLERGLLGNFICANLSAQFEAVQYDWVNLGLQDPRITGSNDPLIGANDGDSGYFDLQTSRGTIRLRGFSRFVRTRGGAYTFLPGIGAIRWIGSNAAGG